MNALVTGGTVDNRIKEAANIIIAIVIHNRPVMINPFTKPDFISHQPGNQLSNSARRTG
jgi:hypothetical protein